MAGDALRTDGAEMAEHLADGLCDSWSHVRCCSEPRCSSPQRYHSCLMSYQEAWLPGMCTSAVANYVHWARSLHWDTPVQVLCISSVQVRYAACAATRAFMEAAAGWREEAFPVLLPPMCLNRRYQAEGVRLYSQRTWELVMGSEGRAWVARLAPQARSQAYCALRPVLIRRTSLPVDLAAGHMPHERRKKLGCFVFPAIGMAPPCYHVNLHCSES